MSKRTRLVGVGDGSLLRFEESLAGEVVSNGVPPLGVDAFSLVNAAAELDSLFLACSRASRFFTATRPAYSGVGRALAN